MKGLGMKVFQRGADESISRIYRMDGKVSKSIYGFRFWAVKADRPGNWYEVYAMTEQSYRAGDSDREKVGEVRETNHHTYYHIIGKPEPLIK